METGHIGIKDQKVYFEPDNKKLLIEISNSKHKREKVFKPAFSEAFISLYYIENQQIFDGQSCKAEILNNKAIITQITTGAIPSWKIKEQIINFTK